MRALSYFVDEALASLRRGYRTALISAATIAAALFVLGGFLVIAVNAQKLFSRWQDAAELSVYLRDDVTPTQRGAIEGALRDSRLVAAMAAISKDDALRRFKSSFGDLARAADDLPENPLPASIEVRLLPDANPSQVDALADRASRMEGVSDVRYDRRWIERLMSAAGLVRLAGFALSVVLICAAALTVASVVRLALVARREEIHIMQLVGAPLGYIRGPFIVEGMIQGGLGAMVAMAALWAAFLVVRTRETSAMAGSIDLSSIVFLSVPMCVALLAGGMALGCLGGAIAARNTREIAD